MTGLTLILPKIPFDFNSSKRNKEIVKEHDDTVIGHLGAGNIESNAMITEKPNPTLLVKIGSIAFLIFGKHQSHNPFGYHATGLILFLYFL